MRWSLVAVLLAATLSGCFGANDENPAAPLDSEDDGTDNPDGNGTDGNGTGPPRGNGTALDNTAPSVEVTANVTNGTTPLNVTFYLNFTDAEQDDLDWSIDFGDGNITNGTSRAEVASNGTNATSGNETAGNGTTPPGSGPDGNATGNTTGNATGNQTDYSQSNYTVVVNHAFNGTGTFNVTVNVTDGLDSFEVTVTIEAAPAAIVFEGEVRSKCNAGVGTCSLVAFAGEEGAPVNAGLGCSGMRSNTQGEQCIWFDLLPEHAGLEFTADSTGGDVDLAFTTSCNENSGRTLALHEAEGAESGTVPNGAACVILWEFGTVPSTVTYTMPL